MAGVTVASSRMAGVTVVFDLDGTLVDTAPDLVETLNVVLAGEGLPAVPFERARNLIGGGAPPPPGACPPPTGRRRAGAASAPPLGGLFPLLFGPIPPRPRPPPPPGAAP